MIEFEGVNMVFNRHKVLSDVSLSIGEGDFIAITGPNGGGKTTLLRLLLKLVNPTSGEVRYSADGLKFGYLPQKNMVDSRFPITVGEVVSMGLKCGLMSRILGGVSERVDDALRDVGMLAERDLAIGNLSGGQLQRTLLARAIIGRPDVLVLDEPLSYIDKTFEPQLYDIIARESQRATVVLVSHEMTTLSKMATRHLIVNGGVEECHAAHHYVSSECQ
ncbi:MAG: ATP-binding cassette domain-containing protein [Muribaculaceae bacterium]|nr:ATP-binding cassette domain-containing protein [Muribaculaceae bacterium]